MGWLGEYQVRLDDSTLFWRTAGAAAAVDPAGAPAGVSAAKTGVAKAADAINVNIQRFMSCAP
jgi:hypothetical protein